MNKYIMHKNIPVVSMYYENKKCTFQILNEQLAPISFKDKSQKQIELEWKQFRQKRILLFTDNNYECVKLYINQKYTNIIDGIKNSTKIINIIHDYINPKISDCFYNVNTNDSYWIKDEMDEITWEEINPRTHELKDICKDKELAQKLEYQNEVSHNNLGIINGATPKIWRHDNSDNVTLYKQGGIIETKAEILSSDILDHTNVPHVKYEEVSDRCCKCRNIANEDYSLVSSEDMINYCKAHDRNIDEFCKTLNSDLYYSTQVIDFLIDNPDRTIHNQGFLRDNETGNIVDLQPLYDHNNAFSDKLNRYYEECSEEYQKALSKAKLALEKTHLKFDDKLTAGVFEDPEKYLRFMKRATDIGVFEKQVVKKWFSEEIQYKINEKYQVKSELDKQYTEPSLEYDFEKQSFVDSKNIVISKKQIEIDNIIKSVIQNKHVVKTNFLGNDKVEIEIDKIKYYYISDDLSSINIFLDNMNNLMTQDKIKENQISKELLDNQIENDSILYEKE